MQEDTKLCANCKKDISAANYVMHEMHCRRHIVLCEHCDEPIPRVEIEQHFNDVHAKVPCERCQQEIPRSNVEKHMESECSKKPMSCEYCELPFPKDEHEEHCYCCGSRTECCPLCRQYIMLKDLALHEASGCTYPEPKPAPTPPAPSSDPFSMAHLQEFLDVDSQLRASDDIPDFTANLRQELLQSNASRSRHRVPERSRRSRNTLTRGSGLNLGTRRNSNNRDDNDPDSSVPLVPDNIPWEAIPPDMDYDTMLALQMAHADWAKDSGQMDRDDRQSPQSLPESPGPEDTIPLRLISDVDTDTQPRDNQDFFIEDGDLAIPCEFCELEVPMSTYLDHVEACPLSNQTAPGDVDFADRNNQVPATHQSASQRNSIPVINNLRSERSDRQYQSSQLPSTFDNEAFVEDVILPCEFCEEMFPSEIIVQHQSVCPANGMVTPRTVTPASGLRSKRSSHPKPDATSAASLSSAIGSRSTTGVTKQRHQPDPTLFNPPQLSDDEEPRSDFFRDQSYKDILQSTSDKYSPAVDRFDDSIARPPRRSSRQLSSEESQDSATAATDPDRPRKSAQRTRASLNQLLQENLGASATSASTTHARGNRRPQRGRQTGENQSAAEARAARSTQVDSRAVMRELDRGQPTASGRMTRQPLSSNPSNLPPMAEGSHNSSTSRQNRNQMFSPELRLKPDHNPTSRRRR